MSTSSRSDLRGTAAASTRFPIARLRYAKSTGLWAIYWRDQNLKFHEYKGKRPSKNIQTLLDYIQDSGDPIFWG